MAQSGQRGKNKVARDVQDEISGGRKRKPGNPGRPKGETERTKMLRDNISKFLHDKQNEFVKSWNQLTPNQQVQTYIDLMEFVLPKQARIENTGDKVAPINLFYVAKGGEDEQQKTIPINKDVNIKLPEHGT